MAKGWCIPGQSEESPSLHGSWSRGALPSFLEFLNCMPLVQALELVLNFQGAKIRPTLGAYSGTLDLIDIPGTRLSPRLCYPGEQSADEKVLPP